MSNHYHLLLCTPHANLPAFMRQLNGVYTQVFNRRYRLDGSLFRGRYKAIVVQEEFYLMRVIRYIHLNPKKAGIVKNLKDYRWSSHGVYLKKEKAPRWLDYQRRDTQEWMEGKKGVRGYQSFVKQEDDKEIEEFYNAKTRGFILGKTDYQDRIAQEYIHSKRCYRGEIPQERKIHQERMAKYVEHWYVESTMSWVKGSGKRDGERIMKHEKWRCVCCGSRWE
jgi:putative transposase